MTHTLARWIFAALIGQGLGLVGPLAHLILIGWLASGFSLRGFCA